MSKESSKNKIDLMKELNEKRLSLHDIRFGTAGSKSKNVKEQKMIKRDIARIYTALGAMANELKIKA
jgi:ribosomal protein L29